MALPASAHATIALRRESHSRAETEDHLNQLLEAASKTVPCPRPGLA